jgi:L-Ala-D/L-Glu epimerase / N-acetyl-D-glutamate racemase
VRRTLSRLSIPLKEPFPTATGIISRRELLLLRLEDEDGAQGFGEAAPLEHYDGARLEDIARALRAPAGPSAPPQARAAEEMARLDLDARRDGRPIGEPGADAVAVNWTLPAGPPDQVAANAAEAVQAGYSCFKLKVGLPDDTERVASVRAAIGPWPALRLDANGGWTVRQAVAAIEALSVHDLELVEQPCGTLEELAEVLHAVDVPIAADESIRTPEDVERAAAERACDVVNVKLAPAGGYAAARAALEAAARSGIAAFLSSTLDGPWGIAAALRLAAAQRPSLACGLATLELFDARLARVLPPPRAGLLAVPAGPGLGVEVSEDALAEVLVEELE